MTQAALKPNAVPNRIEDGIYANMPQEIYRPDGALGSSDHVKLLTNPANYWWESPLNLSRPIERDSPALLRGRATHTHVLEGEAAFTREYMRGPDHSEDMTPGEKAAATKAANTHAAKWKKTMLPAETYDRVVIASAMIKKNPKLATAFEGGAPEISIFWSRDGVRRKARLDYLKPRGVGDLKTVTNTREISFPAACRNTIANFHYEMQAALYLEARSMIPQFYAEGRFDGDDNFRELLKKCAEQKTYAFQFVFLQADRAPITFSRVLSPNNPILEIARREIDVAAENYKDYLQRFGQEQWLLIEDTQELDMSEMPGYWGKDV
jgi:hypothetical protein